MTVAVMRLGSVCGGDVLVRLEVAGARRAISGGRKGVGHPGRVRSGVAVTRKLFPDPSL